MLLPISGKRAAKEEAKAPEPKRAEKPVRAPGRSKKAG
jgi:DNA end-binding protein Ku